jgi:hypothetical protein
MKIHISEHERDILVKVLEFARGFIQEPDINENDIEALMERFELATDDELK